jgi:hypothetical protein
MDLLIHVAQGRERVRRNPGLKLITISFSTRTLVQGVRYFLSNNNTNNVYTNADKLEVATTSIAQ